MYNNLVKYAFPLKSNQAFFAFNHKTTSDKIDEGWLVYNAQQEYERMGVNDTKSKWRITTINKDYKYCETYPNLLAVCHSTSDKELELIAEFRSRNRIPVLSWVKSSSTTANINDNSNSQIDNTKSNPAIMRSYIIIILIINK